MVESVALPTDAFARPHRSLRHDAWRRFRRQAPGMAGLIILLLLVFAAIFAPLLTSYDPVKMNLSEALVAPNSEHLLGTDHLGRDMLARLLYGGRLSLIIGFLAVAIGLVVGLPLGAASGFYGGKADMVIQRIADALLAFPSILLALSLVAVLGVGLRNVIVAVGVAAIPSFIRLVRGSVLSIREETYVEAAHAVGVPHFTILYRHVLPNAISPVIVQATLTLGSAILVAAGLGFLGLGIQPPTAEWGAMLGEGRQYIFSASYMATFPGLAIFLAVLGFNLLGDGLRDALDPRLR